MAAPIEHSLTKTAPIVSGGVIGGALVGLGIYGLAIAAASALGVALIASGIGGLIAGIGISLLIWFLMNRQPEVFNHPASPANRNSVNSDPQDLELQPLNIPYVSPNDVESLQTDPIILPESSEPPAPIPQMDNEEMALAFLDLCKPIHIHKFAQEDFCDHLNLPGVCRGASLVWVQERLNAASSQSVVKRLGGWTPLFERALNIQSFYAAAGRSQAPNRFAKIGAQPMPLGGQGCLAAPLEALKCLHLIADQRIDLTGDDELVEIVHNAPSGFACDIGLLSNTGGHSIAIVKSPCYIELFDANFGIWKIPSEDWSVFFPAFRSSLYQEHTPVMLLPLQRK